MKKPGVEEVQIVCEILLEHERQLGMADEQGRHVEPSKVRNSPAELLHVQPEGKRMKGD